MKFINKVSANPVDDMVGLGKGIFPKGVVFQRKLRMEWDSRNHVATAYRKVDG